MHTYTREYMHMHTHAYMHAVWELCLEADVQNKRNVLVVAHREEIRYVCLSVLQYV